jgi:hypothetical protein
VTEQPSGAMAFKRMLMTLDRQGSPRVIGPVRNDDLIDRLRDEIENAGWTNLGTAPFTSVSDFRAEVKTKEADQ